MLLAIYVIRPGCAGTILKTDAVPRIGERISVEEWHEHKRMLVYYKVADVTYTFRENCDKKDYDPAIISVEVKPVGGD